MIWLFVKNKMVIANDFLDSESELIKLDNLLDTRVAPVAYSLLSKISPFTEVLPRLFCSPLVKKKNCSILHKLPWKPFFHELFLVLSYSISYTNFALFIEKTLYFSAKINESSKILTNLSKGTVSRPAGLTFVFHNCECDTAIRLSASYTLPLP